MIDVTASGKKAVTIPINGAEYLELDYRAVQADLSLPAYVRRCCGLDGWIARGSEMRSRTRPRSRRPSSALARMSVTIMLTAEEYSAMRVQARDAGTSLPQQIRTRCGFHIRNTSLPNTAEREHEEDDAWNRLQRLGVNPRDFFPEE